MIYILKAIEGNTVSYISIKHYKKQNSSLLCGRRKIWGPQTIQYIRLLHGKRVFFYVYRSQ